MFQEVHRARLPKKRFLSGSPWFWLGETSKLTSRGQLPIGVVSPFNPCLCGLEALELLILFQVRGLEPILN
jgi:hypothetical protein